MLSFIALAGCNAGCEKPPHPALRATFPLGWGRLMNGGISADSARAEPLPYGIFYPTCVGRDDPARRKSASVPVSIPLICPSVRAGTPSLKGRLCGRPIGFVFPRRGRCPQRPAGGHRGRSVLCDEEVQRLKDTFRLFATRGFPPSRNTNSRACGPSWLVFLAAVHPRCSRRLNALHRIAQI